MGTRGLYGFRKNGEDKLLYVNNDSYPNFMGEKIIEFCLVAGHDGLHNIYDKITRLLEESSPATEEDIKKYGDILDLKGMDVVDNYTLFHYLQHNPKGYLEDIDVMVTNNEFIKDSLFCEYAYIINLDSDILEYWSGFQKIATSGNRYGEDLNDDGYYPCKLILEIPLKDMSIYGLEKTLEMIMEA